MTQIMTRRFTFRSLLLLVAIAMLGAATSAQAVSWRQALDQSASWYSSDEAADLAKTVLLYQKNSGGWPKNIDYKPLSPDKAKEVASEKDDESSTIDNSATIREMRFLAKMFQATGEPKYKQAVDDGLQWLLEAQYPNGGWPQFYPLRGGYHDDITFNDDAIANVMNLLRDVENENDPFGFVTSEQRKAAHEAFGRGVDIILATQVEANGHRTVWGAQHDVKTLKPSKARAYEHPSLAAMESVPVTRLLMQIDHPEPRVVNAIQAAIRWFDTVKLEGIDMIDTRTEDGQRDRKVVQDPDADPIWARFYEVGTNRPMFSGRDGIIRYDMSEVERERRAGYRWYTRRPLSLLHDEYPQWQQKWAPDENVLAD